VPVDAKPEKITIGPYSVSFDLGNVGAYSISTTEQSEIDTLFGIPFTKYYATIEGRETSEGERIPNLKLTINDFHEAMRADMVGRAEHALGSSFPSCGEPTIVPRTIDNKPGVVCSQACVGFSAYTISYPLDYNAENNSMKSFVQISSEYPWEEGTSSLVKTIHVEKS